MRGRLYSQRGLKIGESDSQWGCKCRNGYNRAYRCIAASASYGMPSASGGHQPPYVCNCSSFMLDPKPHRVEWSCWFHALLAYCFTDCIFGFSRLTLLNIKRSLWRYHDCANAVKLVVTRLRIHDHARLPRLGIAIRMGTTNCGCVHVCYLFPTVGLHGTS